MLRAFITTWSAIDLGSGRRRITNPISSYVESNDIGLTVTCSMFYPDRDLNGLPDKSRILVIAHQPTGATNPQGQTIEAFGNLAGVYMLPAYRFQKPIAEIPQNVKNDVLAKLELEGIPASAVSGLTVYGDFLKKLAKYFQVNHAGFGSHIEFDAELEFE